MSPVLRSRSEERHALVAHLLPDIILSEAQHAPITNPRGATAPSAPAALTYHTNAYRAKGTPAHQSLSGEYGRHDFPAQRPLQPATASTSTKKEEFSIEVLAKVQKSTANEYNRLAEILRKLKPDTSPQASQDITISDGHEDGENAELGTIFISDDTPESKRRGRPPKKAHTVPYEIRDTHAKGRLT